MTFPIIDDEIDIASQDDIDNLAGDVCRRLYGRVRDFRLRLQDNGLILQGSALTYYAKQLAQHAVMQATRLPILANDIEVEVLMLAER